MPGFMASWKWLQISEYAPHPFDERSRRNFREEGRLRITFHGAARQVTGTAHLLEIGPHKILLDCGLFDSNRSDPESPNRQFTFEPGDLDAVVVSHAHNDHI